MKNNRSEVAQRAWKVLRIALLWARKGGVFKRRLEMELRVVPKFLKSLGHHSNNTRRGQLHYGERELSFDKTPIFHVKMHKPASMRFMIPCITPNVDFDGDFNDYEHDHRVSYDGCDACWFDDDDHDNDEGGIDSRAEEFIAKFYEQMKLQRQVSYLQYNQH